MGRITIDDATRDKLAGAGGFSELRDSAGNLVGYFTPKADQRLIPQISEEEILRRMSQGELYTYEEVMAHLRSR